MSHRFKKTRAFLQFRKNAMLTIQLGALLKELSAQTDRRTEQLAALSLPISIWEQIRFLLN